MTKKELKQHLLEELYKQYKNCIACPLAHLGRTNIVFGRGNPDAQLLFIGEGPGKEEDEQALPFIGRSGKLLSKILNQLNINENAIYITNIVKCRPPKNRAPLELEISTCKSILLDKQIQIISPIVICTLGASATKKFITTTQTITKLRGSLQNYNSILLIPTYHPAYILRNQTKLSNFTQDIQKAYIASISNKNKTEK